MKAIEMSLPQFHRVSDNDQCCGCTACMAVCPEKAVSIKTNPKGFYAAEVDESKCIKCGKCLQVCPFAQAPQLENPDPTVYAVQVKDSLKRITSQSGGAYRVFAEEVLKKEGVLYGVVMNGNQAVYARIESWDVKECLSGSKYVQALVGDTLLQVKEDLISGRDVFVCGTPCFIDGLKMYLTSGRVETTKLFTADIICHGVPSPGIFKQYIDMLSENHTREITDFNFRDKIFSWGSHVCSYFDGTTRVFSENWVNIFYSHLCLNETCYVCPYANIKRVGDVTIGDCWGIEESQPEMNDFLGTSMVLLNTEKGREFFRRIKPEIVSQRFEVNYDRQPNLYMPTQKPKEYEEFWNQYYREGFFRAIEQYCSYRSDEKALVERLGWNLYQELFKHLSKRSDSIFLYGVGLTMWQMIYYIEKEQENIAIQGILDRDTARWGDSFLGYPVCREDRLPDGKFVVVLCAKNKDSIMEVTKRLSADKKYKGAEIYNLYWHENIQEGELK